MLAVCTLTACRTASPGDPPKNPLQIDADSYDFADNPAAFERIRQRPHGYFRFINRKFADEVCRRFEAQLPRMPEVNLHGDAHLEQYAVTDRSRGLSDFDDSSTGPAVLDLIRFGVSIYLIAHERAWESSAPDLFDVFLDGYLAALEEPTFEAPPPVLATRLRERFHQDRATFLAWAARVVEPVSPERRAQLEQALAPAFARMVESPQNDADDLGFFEIRTIGRLKLGIGSALDEKYLVRVEGESPDPEDDVVLELKEVRDLSGVSCVDGAARVDPFRILVTQYRIAYTPYLYLGYLELDGRTFWLHSWVMNYRELDAGVMLSRPEELAEVVFDVGVQLGLGHPNDIARPMDRELRSELRDMVTDLRPELTDMVVELYSEVLRAWRTFAASPVPPAANP